MQYEITHRTMHQDAHKKSKRMLLVPKPADVVYGMYEILVCDLMNYSTEEEELQ